MVPSLDDLAQPVLIGRSSSHFTRVTRIVAAELDVDYSLQVVRDLTSCALSDYGGNPALKLPALRTNEATWFGSLNVCRELARLSHRELHLVWPEHLTTPLLANAQELTLQAMATEVQLIMAAASGPAEASPHQRKMRQALQNTLEWLDHHLPAVLDALPPQRDLSYLETTLFCLVTHLEFRQVLPVSGYPALTELCQTFGARPSAQATPYRFDP